MSKGFQIVVYAPFGGRSYVARYLRWCQTLEIARGLYLIIAALLCAFASPNTLAASCIPKAQERTNLPRFTDEASFDMQIRPTVDGTDIRVTGDIVLINKSTLSSILAEPSIAKTKIAKLTFDGRIVRIAGPLSLVDARLHITGETVRFEKNGRISLQAGSPQKGRSLRIVAKTIEFDGGPKRPINLNLASNQKVLSEIVAETGISTADKAWALHVDSLDIDVAPKENAKFAFGADALETVSQVYKGESEWPLFFAAKLRKHFERSPYAKETHEDVGTIADSYEKKIAEWSNPKPIAILKSIQLAIQNKTDSSGKSRSFTPKKDLVAQKKDLLGLIEKNQFDALIEIIATKGNDTPQKKAILDETRKQISANVQEVKAKQIEIDRLSSSLQALAQSLKGTDTLIDQRRHYLEIMQKRDFERMKDAQAVKQWTTVAASAVVIAASMGAAAPAVAAGAAAGLGATGEAIYSHNAGKPLSLSEVIAAGTKSYEAAQKYQAAWAQFQEAGKVRSEVYGGKGVLKGPKPSEGPDNRKPMTKTDVTVDYLGALASAAKAASELNSNEVAGPTPITMSEREDADEVMKALVSKRAQDKQDSSLVAERIKAATAEFNALVSRSIELEETDSVLRVVNAKNDQESARWNASALALWQAEVERISAAVMTFKRSLYFESGSVPGGIPEVLDYPNELQSQISVGILDPFGGSGPLAPENDLRQRLGGQRNLFIASVQANYDAVVDAYRSYLDSRNEADVYRQVFEIRGDSKDVVKRRFIQALNGQIAQQIVGGTSVQSLLPAYVPIELPIPASEYPERLVNAAIVDVKFNVPTENIGVGALQFVLTHPGYGEMRRKDECFPADFRRTPTDWRRFTTTLEQVTPKWTSRKPTKVEISESQSDRYYTYLPARTPYHLLVNVVSKNWLSLPRIESIHIGLEVMQ